MIDEAERDREMRKGQAGWNEDQEDFLRGVGDRRQGVGGEDGQGQAFRKPFVGGLCSLQWIADEPTFQDHRCHYRT